MLCCEVRVSIQSTKFKQAVEVGVAGILGMATLGAVIGPVAIPLVIAEIIAAR